MTTPPTPPITASVGSPTPIPERPTLYAIIYMDDRGYWAIDSMHGIKDYADMKHTTRPGSVLVTIPGSTTTPDLRAVVEAIDKAIDQFKYMLDRMHDGPWPDTNSDSEVASRIEELTLACTALEKKP